MRSLSYSAALSVATVMIASAAPSSRCLAILIAAMMLALPEMPMLSSCLSASGSILCRLREIARPTASLNSRLSASDCAIGYADYEVGVHHVVDERDVLVADALDVVLAVAVAQHRRAFDRLDGGYPRAVKRLEVVAGGDRPCRARRRNEGRETTALAPFGACVEHAIERARLCRDNG